MKKRNRTFIAALCAVLFALAWVTSPMAAEEEKPDATLKLSEGQVAVGIGWSWGKGVLTFKRKHYPFKVDGLSVVDVGVTKANAVGKVYHLKKLSDFNGTYTAAAAEGTLGGGAGISTMKNQNGVVIQLISTTQGVNVKLAGEGVKLTLEKK
jgi:plastocyanin domain-containing protein